MRFWKITRWNGVQLAMNVVEASSIYYALLVNAGDNADPTIIKIEEVGDTL